MHLRPPQPGDDHDIRRVFRVTLALGHPVPLAAATGALLSPYERLCLEWYLGPGRSGAALLCTDERVVGYALVCLDPRAFARWQRRAALRFMVQVAPRVVARRYPTAVDRFYRLRLRDGWGLWRHRDDRVAHLPHAHLNACDTMGALAGRLLADHVDAVVAKAGFHAWYGEINARAGRRVAALDRWGSEVITRQPNTTLTWLIGAPVERLTVLRRIPAHHRAA